MGSRLSGILILVGLLGLAAQPCLGWGVAGHMVVTQIAYERLEPETRAEVDRLVELLADFEPKSDHAMTASLWMDQVRGAGWRSMDRWHYMSLPYNADGLAEMPSVHPDNAVEAIRQSIRTLKSPEAPDLAKAIMLRVLLHVVGDLHQPLHSASRITAERPEGDRGGNDFRLLDTEGKPSNLHRLWDSGFGALPKLTADAAGMEAAVPVAVRIVERVPEDRVPEWRDPDPEQWSRESFRLVTSVVYEGISEGRAPSEVYQAKARLVIQRRIALAGYRLAATLEDALSPSLFTRTIPKPQPAEKGETPRH